MRQVQRLPETAAIKGRIGSKEDDRYQGKESQQHAAYLGGKGPGKTGHQCHSRHGLDGRQQESQHLGKAFSQSQVKKLYIFCYDQPRPYGIDEFEHARQEQHSSDQEGANAPDIMEKCFHTRSK